MAFPTTLTLIGAISMCIYCGTTRYRKIYENHYGKIPKDETGRSYEIHHIDGNHDNNDPTNLTCVSIQEHYDIHHSREDWGACIAIGVRMKKSHDELSAVARKNAMKKIEDGTHPFLGLNERRVAAGTHQFLGGEIPRIAQLKRVKDGTHHFLDGRISKKSNRERLENGTHHLLRGGIQSAGNIKRLTNGTRPSQIKLTCNHCGKVVDSANYGRWHGPKCKTQRL